MNSDARGAENSLIPPAEYDRLAPTQVPRYRVLWSHLQLHLWSARRVSSNCVVELEVDTLLKHLKRPKGYIFPSPTAPRSNAATPESEWILRLLTSAQMLALYQQEF